MKLSLFSILSSHAKCLWIGDEEFHITSLHLTRVGEYDDMLAFLPEALLQLSAGLLLLTGSTRNYVLK